MRNYELLPQFDSKKSFYGKARVEEENNISTLYSYDSKIIELDRTTNKLKRVYMAGFSKTTLRHVKEFLRQNDFDVNTLKDVLALLDN